MLQARFFAGMNTKQIPCSRCLVSLLAQASSFRSYAVEAALFQREASYSSSITPTSYYITKQPDQQAVALWQQVAGLTAAQAQQLLQEQPKLGSFLQAGYDSSTFAQNLHLLRCHGAGIRSGAGVPTKLRAYLALAPHQALQHAKQVEQLIAGQAIDQKLHGQHQYAVIMQQLTAHVEALVAHAGHRARKVQQQQQQVSEPGAPTVQHDTARSLQQNQEQQLHMQKHQIPDLIQLLGKNKTQRLRSMLNQVPQLQQLDDRLLLVAAAVLEALQLPYGESLPDDMRPRRLQEVTSSPTAANRNSIQAEPAAEPVSSSGSKHGKRRKRRNKTSSSSSSSSSSLEVLPADHSMLSALCYMLGSTCRRVDLKNRPMPESKYAVALAKQLQLRLGSLAALQLLLARPSLLWLGSSPSRVLAQLQQQLPDVNTRQLLLSSPGVLLIPHSQVSELLALLTGRLALSRAQVASVIQQHPQLLQCSAKGASINLGFLVGLGLRPAELQAMLLKSPTWITRPLKELTVQWQFVTAVAKASQSDVVLLPDLLSLPISRLAPRILYARKRQVKLLLPSHAAMLPALSPSEWLKHKLVPLQFWITATDKRMCQAVGLDADDYSRFKAAWIRVDAFSWSQAAADSKGK